MVPRNKKPRANPATEQEEENETEKEDRFASLSGMGMKGELPISRRSGEILIYAISFALVVAAIGLVVAQIITALKLTGASLKESAGFILWMCITFICALVSRSGW